MTNKDIIIFCKVLEEIKSRNKNEKVTEAILTLKGVIAKKIPKAKIVEDKKTVMPF